MKSEMFPSALGPLPSDWQVLPFGSVFERAGKPIEVEPSALYREIGIRSHGKGIFHKEAVTGASLGNKRVFSIVPNCLVFNIVFAWEGAVAVTSTAELGMIGSHRFPLFQPKDGLADVDFLLRFFQMKEGVSLLGDASPGGAGRNRTLNQKLTAAIPVPVPPLREQQKIVSVLASVDQSIETTQSVINQLGVVKKALMSELMTRGLPGHHTKFKQTEIGKVPEDWKVEPLGALLLSIDSGWSPQCESRPAEISEWGVLKVSAVSWGIFRPEENKRLPSNLEPRHDAEIRQGDLLLSRANTPDLVGRCVLVELTRPRLMLSDKILRLRVRQDAVLAEYLNLVLGANNARQQIEDGATGSSRSMKNLSQEKLRAVLVPVPPLEEQAAIAHLFKSLRARTAVDNDCLNALRLIKTSLMSALLTGELRVTPNQEPA